MTTDSFRVDQPAGWFVVTDQGVVLSGRFETEAAALVERAVVIDRLRCELARAGRPSVFITERVAAIGVDYGVRAGAWRGFERRLPP